MLRGEREETAAAATALVRELETVLWVSSRESPGFEVTAPNAVKRTLGQSFDAVVLDLHDGVDPDVLGQCHGLVWGGGALVMRLPDELPPPGKLAAYPYEPTEVRPRFEQHFERALERAAFPASAELFVTKAETGTAGQAAVARELAELLLGEEPRCGVIVADRGRGKSSALGLAIRAALGRNPQLRIAVTAGQRTSADEVFRFAMGSLWGAGGSPARCDVVWVDANALHAISEAYDVIVVDEAAQLPVPLLQRITLHHPNARMAFATTTHGYEGTGRGFVLRFLDWLDEERATTRFELREPIRWAADDPLERFVFDALLLDAEPSDIDSVDLSRVEAEEVDRDELVADELALREFFGLLIQAHYRTTPGDLQRLLDAPNVGLHALRHDGRIIAATLVAYEGDLPDELVDDIYWGRTRLTGHALPESLVTHLGHREAGAMRMVRSIRIAVHPNLRRLGLGSRLIAHVHGCFGAGAARPRFAPFDGAPDLFGTLFGATPELVSFRRQAGYEVVRIGASRGSRTGEPAVVMVRPVSDRARCLVTQLRAELARDLPLQLELLQADGEPPLNPELERALLVDLPPAADLSRAAMDEAVRTYAHGPRTYESIATAITAFVGLHSELLPTLAPEHRRLVEARVVDRLSWIATAERASMTVPGAMRALRRAIRELYDTKLPFQTQ